MNKGSLCPRGSEFILASSYLVCDVTVVPSRFGQYAFPTAGAFPGILLGAEPLKPSPRSRGAWLGEDE